MSDYLDLPVRSFLRVLAEDRPAPAGGSAAALGVALAASLCVMTARRSTRQLTEAGELAAQAERLAAAVAPLVQADADAYRAVIAALSDAISDALSDALSDAADVPLRIAEIGAQVAPIAARLAVRGNPNLHGDAVTAGHLADAGVRSACELVRINLSAASSDERLARVAILLAGLPSVALFPHGAPQAHVRLGVQPHGCGNHVVGTTWLWQPCGYSSPAGSIAQSEPCGGAVHGRDALIIVILKGGARGLPGYLAVRCHRVEVGLAGRRGSAVAVPWHRVKLDRDHRAGRLEQACHPGRPPYLAVGEDLDTCLALDVDRFQRGAVLEFSQLLGGQRALLAG